jgi:hypothetical protein
MTRALGTFALFILAWTCMAYACTGCAVHAEPPPSHAPYVYSHTIQGGAPEGCGYLVTTDPRVLLECAPGAELARMCEFADGSPDGVDVYALPGAGDETPFGVATYIELHVLAVCP